MGFHFALDKSPSLGLRLHIMKLAYGLLGCFLLMPIWWFLIYTILAAIHPDRLVWFLFFVYIPLGIVMKGIEIAIERQKDKAKGA